MMLVNKKDGFVADWKDVKQHKFSIDYNYNCFKNHWEKTSSLWFRSNGIVYMSKESAEYLCDMLNKGLINNVSKTWEN